MSTAQALANQRHRAYLHEALSHAAEHFHLTLCDPPLFGWHDRTIGARATSPHGERWLRVTSENFRWASGNYWTGNADATAITGVPKPAVLDVYEWDDTPNRLRAEVMTLLCGDVCSPTNELRNDLDLPPTWWDDLHQALNHLASTPTSRVAVDQATITRRLSVFFGDAIDPTVSEWTTAHGDLHWNNLIGPHLGILDWESWGTAPAGLDAATLYCHSLLVPETAARVREAFAEQLDTPDGIRAQLYAITRLLLRIERGDHDDLAIPLHRHAASLINRR
ncbi:aminoglycoside phosphotransferase [Lipingzhangella sp. LS1_29]|uniref:Aminoglycoside phosphotransferase n=1 Tax=Lipingzhangella rawalii TaxID=2055835 RepID=A0ABU2HA98_9ACTN|nr:phosphotransferase [Lipingzhangella rawalii]MDS1271794.1 aminoglycoside phosphotransferase [Lipingzhangella rawalii]